MAWKSPKRNRRYISRALWPQFVGSSTQFFTVQLSSTLSLFLFLSLTLRAGLSLLYPSILSLDILVVYTFFLAEPLSLHFNNFSLKHPHGLFYTISIKMKYSVPVVLALSSSAAAAPFGDYLDAIFGTKDTRQAPPPPPGFPSMGMPPMGSPTPGFPPMGPPMGTGAPTPGFPPMGPPSGLPPMGAPTPGFPPMGPPIGTGAPTPPGFPMPMPTGGAFPGGPGGPCGSSNMPPSWPVRARAARNLAIDYQLAPRQGGDLPLPSFSLADPENGGAPAPTESPTGGEEAPGGFPGLPTPTGAPEGPGGGFPAPTGGFPGLPTGAPEGPGGPGGFPTELPSFPMPTGMPGGSGGFPGLPGTGMPGLPTTMETMTRGPKPTGMPELPGQEDGQQGPGGDNGSGGWWSWLGGLFGGGKGDGEGAGAGEGAGSGIGA